MWDNESPYHYVQLKAAQIISVKGKSLKSPLQEIALNSPHALSGPEDSWPIGCPEQSISHFCRNTQKVPAASLSLPLNHTSLAGVKLLKELIPGNGEKNEKEIKLNGCLQRTPAVHYWFPCNLHLSPWNFFIISLAQGHRQAWCCSCLEFDQEKKHSLICPWRPRGPRWVLWWRARERRFSLPCPSGKAQATGHWNQGGSLAYWLPTLLGVWSLKVVSP